MRKFFFEFAVWIYCFIIIGFILHTSIGKEQIFGKYSRGYLVILICVIVGFLPYLALIRYLSGVSKYSVLKRKFILKPVNKIFFILLLSVLIIATAETYMRMHNMQIRHPIENMNFHPFLQQFPRPNDSDYHQNSYGFRADEITKTKPKDTYRIVILGGSTAYGVGVPYEHTAPKLLQDMLRQKYKRKIEVINAAVSSYTSEHTLIEYQFLVHDFSPNLVIILQGNNDLLASCSDTENYPYLPYQVDYSHILGPYGHMVTRYFSPPVVSINLVSINYLYYWFAQYMYTDLVSWINQIEEEQLISRIAKLPLGAMPISSLQSYQRNLQYQITTIKSDKVSLIFVNQPSALSTETLYEKFGILTCEGKKLSLKSLIKGMTEYNDSTKNLAQSNNVPFIDLDSLIPKNSDYFIDYVHWSVKGHNLAANALYKFIVQGKFISD